jgi:uncharacterized protein YbjT (DUF2867 family)
MENKNLLITGATGNIGLEVIRGLKEIAPQINILAGSHSVEKSKKALADYTVSEFRKIDFADSSTFDSALKDIDIVFLLRPPQLADVPKYFAPFIQAMKERNIAKIVFLSVQGAEKQKYIPHYKIEQLILDAGMDYVFLRPGYFMQNLTTTLSHEIKTQNKIVVPSGNLKFNWVDAQDIGLAGAYILNDFEKYKNRSFELTGSEFAGFHEVAAVLSDVLGRTIRYESPNLIRYILNKQKQGILLPMIFVMIMLHFFPRFGKNNPRLTNTVTNITGRRPGTIREFAEREKVDFL